MSTITIRPSTLAGIRQLAKKLRRERNIPHRRALDLASVQAGFENFVHAKRCLESEQATPALSPPGVFRAFLSIHWSAPSAGAREVLQVTLSRPLSALVPTTLVASAPHLAGFRMEYEDHLAHLTPVDSKAAARDVLRKATRTIRFMEATGLQPAPPMRQGALRRELHQLPGADHGSLWIDPSTSGWTLLDEPHARVRTPRRDEWLQRRGLHCLIPQGWSGLYMPVVCKPHFIGQDPEALHALAASLATAKRAGERYRPQGACGVVFVSPQRIADAQMRRPPSA